MGVNVRDDGDGFYRFGNRGIGNFSEETDMLRKLAYAEKYNDIWADLDGNVQRKAAVIEEIGNNRLAEERARKAAEDAESNRIAAERQQTQRPLQTTATPQTPPATPQTPSTTPQPQRTTTPTPQPQRTTPVQQHQRQKPLVHFELLGGVNMTTIYTGGDITSAKFFDRDFNAIFQETFEPKFDFHAGMALSFGRRWFRTSFEGIYSRQGFVNQEDKGNLNINFDYVKGCMLFQIRMGRSWGLLFDFGPYVGYLLSVNPEYATFNGDIITLSDLQGGMDAGGALGARIFAGRFSFGARCHVGLLELRKDLQWTNMVGMASIRVRL